ncbi:Ig-like domain-containing protein [Pseudooceanicola atlanticus]|uniref:Ig-like domain-containing protein n=1 Tax=Pseudooceanicola atlanticus TaxID=1461694 RepID=UPI002354313B|nr:Ig-like domain-containing protein [Pseudooceanicola atlanticus]
MTITTRLLNDVLINSQGLSISAEKQGRLGQTVEVLGDVNGDGYGDFAVWGATAGPEFSVFSGSGGGAVYYGGPDVFSPAEQLLQDAPTFLAFSSSTGGTIAGLGDVNGDGFDDVGVTNNGEGLFVFLGGAAGLGSTPLDVEADADLSWSATTPFNLQPEVYGALATGDFNGDGIADIVLGNGEGGDQGQGYVRVLFGGPTLASADLNALDGTNGFEILGSTAGDDFGHSVSVGDLNNDGLDDLVIGAPNLGQFDDGGVYVIYGRDSAAGDTFDNVEDLSLGVDGMSLIRGGIAGDSFNYRDYLAGLNVDAGGDFNGDGIDDLTFSAPGNLRVYVLEGRDGGFGGPTLGMAGINSISGASGFVMRNFTTDDLQPRFAGDLDGDGIDELAIAVAFEPANGGFIADSGEAVFIKGGEARPTTTYLTSSSTNGVTILTGDPVTSVAGGLDLTGDGKADLVLGNFYAPVGQASLSGEVIVLPDINPVQVQFGTDAADALAGDAEANRIDGLGGNDTIEGLGENDTLFGSDGNDTLRGGSGNDSLLGQEDDDRIEGDDPGDTTGEDVLSGGGGNDTLVSLAGVDTAQGGDGEDLLIWDRSGLTTGITLTVGDVFDIEARDASSILLTTVQNVEQFDLVLGAAGDAVTLASGDDRVDGRGGNDNISGGDGNDTILGGVGNDILRGGADNDLLEGGRGIDELYSTEGRDTLDGGEDVDQAYIDRSAATNAVGFLQAADGSFRITGGNAETVTLRNIERIRLEAGSGNDSINASTGFGLEASYFDMGRGDDTLTFGGLISAAGGSGDDVMTRVDGGSIFGDEGNDTLSLLSGEGELYGRAGNDVLFNGDGSNVSLVGGSGHDELTARSGDDTLNAGSGDDTLDAGAGADILRGHQGNDSISGGSGDDSILGGLGSDTLLGGAGKDTIEFGTEADLVDGGSGDDVITAETNVGPDATSAHTLIGGAGEDNLTASDNDSSIEGGSGDDVLYSGDGDDTLFGGEGNDLLNAGSGSNLIYAGAGDDQITMSGQNDTVRGGSGIDTVRLNLGSEIGNQVVDLARFNVTEVEGAEITTGGGNDTVQGLSGKDIIRTGIGADSVTSGLGDDLVYAGAGNDYIDGGEGHDWLDGGSGDDTIYGRGGNDTLVGGEGDDYIDAGDGADLLVGGAGRDVLTFTYDNGMPVIEADADDIVEASFSTTPTQAAPVILTRKTGSGSPGPEEATPPVPDIKPTIIALDFKDVIRGSDGNDTILAGGGADSINGAVGDDMILGQGGNDTLAGGPGNDTLVGGNDFAHDDGEFDELLYTSSFAWDGIVTYSGGEMIVDVSGFARTAAEVDPGSIDRDPVSGEILSGDFVSEGRDVIWGMDAIRFRSAGNGPDAVLTDSVFQISYLADGPNVSALAFDDTLRADLAAPDNFSQAGGRVVEGAGSVLTNDVNPDEDAARNDTKRVVGLVNGTEQADGSFVATGAHGTLTLRTDGTWRYEYFADQGALIDRFERLNENAIEEIETFTYEMSDGRSAPVTAALKIEADYLGAVQDPVQQLDLTIEALPEVFEATGSDREVSYTFRLSEATEGRIDVDWALIGAEVGENVVLANDFADTQPLNGRLIFAAGEQEKILNVLVRGDALGELPEDIPLFINVTNREPELSVATLTSDIPRATIIDDDGIDPGTGGGTPGKSAGVSVTAPIQQVEGTSQTPTQVTFVITLSAPLDAPVTLDWSLSGPASDAADLSGPASGQVSFAAGQTTAEIDVAVKADTLVELDEDLTLSIVSASAPDGTAIGLTRPSATIRIVNDDRAEVSVSTRDSIEGGPILVEATLDAATDADIHVPWELMLPGGQRGATAGDLEAGALTSGIITIDAGTTRGTATIDTFDDVIDEKDETFEVRIESPTNLEGRDISLGNDSATGQIIDDDGVVLILTAPQGVEEGTDVDGVLPFEVILFNPVSGERVTSQTDITADWKVFLGANHGSSALSADDLAEGQALTGNVTIPAGQSSAVINLNINADSDIEDDERVTLLLTDVTAADGSTVPTAALTANSLVLDDDGITVKVESAQTEIEEGDPGDPKSVEYVFTRGGDTSKRVVVDWAMQVDNDEERTYTDYEFVPNHGWIYEVPEQLYQDGVPGVIPIYTTFRGWDYFMTPDDFEALENEPSWFYLRKANLVVAEQKTVTDAQTFGSATTQQTDLSLNHRIVHNIDIRENSPDPQLDGIDISAIPERITLFEHFVSGPDIASVLGGSVTADYDFGTYVDVIFEDATQPQFQLYLSQLAEVSLPNFVRPGEIFSVSVMSDLSDTQFDGNVLNGGYSSIGVEAGISLTNASLRTTFSTDEIGGAIAALYPGLSFDETIQFNDIDELIQLGLLDEDGKSFGVKDLLPSGSVDPAVLDQLPDITVSFEVSDGDPVFKVEDLGDRYYGEANNTLVTLNGSVTDLLPYLGNVLSVSAERSKAVTVQGQEIEGKLSAEATLLDISLAGGLGMRTTMEFEPDFFYANVEIEGLGVEEDMVMASAPNPATFTAPDDSGVLYGSISYNQSGKLTLRGSIAPTGTYSIEFLKAQLSATLDTPVDEFELFEVEKGPFLEAPAAGDGFTSTDLANLVIFEAVVPDYTFTERSYDFTIPVFDPQGIELTGQVVFEPGETEKTVSLGIIPDEDPEVHVTANMNVLEAKSSDGNPVRVLNQVASTRILDEDYDNEELRERWEEEQDKRWDYLVELFSTNAWMAGDPHLQTLDGLGYSFQVVGEFVLLRSTTQFPLEVQVRTEPSEGSNLVSAVTAVAIQHLATKVTLAIGRDAPLWVNGTARFIADGETATLIGMDVTRSGDEYLVRTSAGDNFEIRLQDAHIDLSPVPSGLRTHAVEGLLGNFDGDATNDLQLGDGTVLGTSPSYSTLYGSFADAWRVTDATSLLDYADGETTADFTDLTFPAAHVTLEDLPDDVVAAATAAVDSRGITDPQIRENAILDYALTGDASYIDGASRLSLQSSGSPDRVTVAAAPDLGAAVSVRAAGDSVTEADAAAADIGFVVFRFGDVTQAATFNWSIGGDVDAMDLAPGQALTGTVTFAADQTEALIFVSVADDTDAERDEALRLRISDPSGTATVARATSETLLINDDGPLPATYRVETGQRIIEEGDPETPSVLRITVYRDGDTSVASSLDVTVSNTELFSDIPSQVDFAAGDDSATLAIPLMADLEPGSPSETEVTITTPTGAILVPVTVTDSDKPLIVNDDFASVEAGTSTTIAILDNDNGFDLRLANSNAVSLGQAANGAVSLDQSGTRVIYTPKTGYFGADSFTYSLLAASGLTSDVATVSVDVAPLSRIASAMTAQDDTVSTAAFQPITFDVRGNDSGAAGLVPVIEEGPDIGTARVLGDGRIHYSAPDDLTIPVGEVRLTSLSYRVTDGADTDTAMVLIQLLGQEPDGTVNGLPRLNALVGQGDDDMIIGGAGNDRLNGRDGDDTLDGGSGQDISFGGNGSDLHIVRDAGDRVVERADWTGRDIVNVYSEVFDEPDAFVEEIRLVGPDARVAKGNLGNNRLIGNDGDNVLDGGRGADLMIGGAGDERYVIRTRGDVALEEADAGIDFVMAHRNHALEANIEWLALAKVEKKDGSLRDLNAVGNDLNNTIVGNMQNNTLIGRGGSDTLKGQGGADTFVFDSFIGKRSDRIVDFDAAEGDRIVLSADLFGLTPGALTPELFTMAAAATGSDYRLVFDGALNALSFDPDGDGARAERVIVRMDGVDVLTADDIFVV